MASWRTKYWGWLLLVGLGLAGFAGCGGTTRGNSNDSAGGASAGTGLSTAAAGAAASSPGGSSGRAGASEGGGSPASCPPLDCLDRGSPGWHPGREVVEPAEGCPFCDVISSCQLARCSYVVDTLGQPQPLPPELDCPQGYEVGVPPGGCCFDCVRNQELIGPLICPEPCLDEPPTCPLGYQPAYREGECCAACIVDVNYCTGDADCTLAVLPPPCCPRIRGISKRLFEHDQCYSDVQQSRPAPSACSSSPSCSTAPCYDQEDVPADARCSEHQCGPL